MAVYELMPVTPSLRTRITNGAPIDELREHARREGMVTLYEDGARKAARGLTTLDEVKKVAPAPAAGRGAVVAFPRALPAPGAGEVHGQVVLTCLSSPGPHARTRERLGRLLEAEGIEVVAVDTRDDRLDAARKRSPSLVVIEHATGADAFEQLARLAGLPGPSVPRLVLTDDRSPSTELALLDAGADDVRAAPAQSKLLAALIRRRLAVRRPA
jgi:CheY-like chemotaxis protein